MESQIVSKLKQFGFTKNEARAFIALQKQHPATGYEISQLSGVPRSAIYDVLKRMELNGIVSSESTRPVLYVPIQPEQLSANLISRFEHNIHELQNSLAEIRTIKQEKSTWSLKGYSAMIDQARSMIDNATDSVYFSIWNREYEALRQQLENSRKRGIDICSFSFTSINNPISELLSYGADEEQLREIWHRQIIMIVDKKTVLMGSADKTPENHSICTNNPAIVNISLNYLILDITLYSQRRKVNVDLIMQRLISDELEGLEQLLKI